MQRRVFYIGIGLIIFFSVLFIAATTSGPTVTFNTGPKGTGATLSDHKVGITATLDLSVAPQPYYGDAHDSQFYYQSNGLLSWLEWVQNLRPGVGWRDWQVNGQIATMQLAGLGAEEGSPI